MESKHFHLRQSTRLLYTVNKKKPFTTFSHPSENRGRMPVPVLDNRDLNNVALISHIADDTSIGDDVEEDEDEKTIEVTDIARHFWTRTNDIRYQVANRGRNFYLTATELQDRFEGVKIALWAY